METHRNPILKTEYAVAAVVLGAFVGLRLIDVIDWSWAWVLAPMWLMAVIAALAPVAALVIHGMTAVPVVSGPPVKKARWLSRRRAHRAPPGLAAARH